jgi:uncharacterized protein (TIGR02302 family)
MRRLLLARAALFWESLWPALWPLTLLVLVFFTLAGFDLLAALPGWLRAIVQLAFLLGALAAVVAALRRVRLPDRAAAERRLERDSGLAHRPLSALQDRLAPPAGDALTEALWAAHRRQMREAVGRLRLGWPRAGLVEADPYALRAGLSLLILLAGITAGDDFLPRLGRALVPAGGASRDVAAASSVDLWITPPAYTGLPPIWRGPAEAAATGDQPLIVPVGSTILAQLHGGSTVPRLALDGKPTDFTRLGAGDFSVTLPIGTASRLAISQDGTILAQYPITILPDAPPTASWGGPPQVTQAQAVRLDVRADDDYGVKTLTLEIRRDGSQEPAREIALPVPAEAAREIKGPSYQDLTASPWAGMPVTMTLVARDALDQIGTSAPLSMVLPEHVFHHPVAKALAEQRKLLIRDPGQATAIAGTIGDLSAEPGAYGNDLAAFLAMRAAARRLMLDTSPEARDSVADALWSTALRIDQGDTPAAQTALREAQKALQEALDRNAPDAEIQKLMAQLNQAIDRFLKSMVANGQKPQAPPQAGDGRTVSRQDIQKMLDRAKEMAQSGDREAAKQALAQLQDLLESLRAGTPNPQGQSAAQQAMRNLQDLAQKQQQLLDRAWRQTQQSREHAQGGQGQPQPGQPAAGPSPPGGDGDSQQMAQAQEALRHQLGEMMRQLGEGGKIPQSLGRAERAMRNAAEALQHNEPGGALDPQGQALDQLQQASHDLMEEMRQAQGTGGPQGEGGQRDPFGREGGTEVDNGSVKLPAQMDLQRSREILDELRRRAGERDRPQPERDYIDRLLHRL